MPAATSNEGVSRRTVLRASGLAAGLAVLPWSTVEAARRAEAAAPAAARRRPDLFTSGFPRLLGFRQSETTIDLTDWTYEQWAANFDRTGGILGKVFREERCTLSDRVLEWFTRYKRENPEKLVIVHFNGRSRLPLLDGEPMFPGFWVYRAGTELTTALAPADTTMAVGSSASFSLTEGFQLNLGSDVVIAARDAQGRPDFTASEQVTVTAIAGNSVTVQRGRYGTTPRAFDAGAYVAAHHVEGPYEAGCGLLWYYNFSTTAPSDPDGKMLYEVLAEQIGGWFAHGGPLHALDGIQLDVFEYGLPPRAAANADLDNDGVGDTGVYLGEFDGLNTVFQGATMFLHKARAALGRDRLFLVDDYVSKPSFTAVNGVELEGFPDPFASDMSGWSTAMSKLEFWRDRHAGKPFSYTNYKWSPPLAAPAGFAPFRLALAGTLFADAVMAPFMNYKGTYDYDTPLAVWDELISGADNQPNWLGDPRGPAVHLGLDTPDLLGGAGLRITGQFLSRITADNGDFLRVRRQGRPYVEVTPDPDVPRSTLTVTGLEIEGPDLLVSFDITADAQPDYGPTVPRQVTVKSVNADGTVTRTSLCWAPPGDFQRVVIYGANVGARAVTLTVSVEGASTWSIGRLTAHDAADTMVRVFRNGLVLANPSQSPQSFDLRRIAHHKRYRRLLATPGQDSTTNNGQPVGATVTVPARDALLLASDDTRPGNRAP